LPVDHELDHFLFADHSGLGLSVLQPFEAKSADYIAATVPIDSYVMEPGFWRRIDITSLETISHESPSDAQAASRCDDCKMVERPPPLPLERQFPGFADDVYAEAVAGFLLDKFVTCLTVDMSCSGEYVMCP
jgi:hypothetical protein